MKRKHVVRSQFNSIRKGIEFINLTAYPFGERESELYKNLMSSLDKYEKEAFSQPGMD